MTKKLKTIIIALAASGIYMQVNAQDYIYKINNGSSVIYTDRVPANEKREFTILSSKSGTVKKVIEKELTDFEAEERKKQNCYGCF
jgi:lipopolysaccharide/colanic/teichoic acid biosynthesis glycosyltransferase